MAESNATQVILTDDGIKIINAQNTADNAASQAENADSAALIAQSTANAAKSAADSNYNYANSEIAVQSNATSKAQSTADNAFSQATTAIDNDKVTSQSVTDLKDGSKLTIADLENGLATKVANSDYASYKVQTASQIAQKVDNGAFSAYQTTTADLIAQKVATSDFSAYQATTAKEISSKVESSDFKTYQTQTTDMIASKVSTVDFNNLTISNRNLALGTATPITFPGKNIDNQAQVGYQFSSVIPLGTVVTVTFDVSSSTGVGEFVMQFYGSDSGSNWQTIAKDNLVNGTKHVSVTLTTTGTHLHVYPRINFATGNIAFSNFIISESSKEVNWTPAPEDQASQTQITQLSDDINLRVTKGDLIDEINLQAGNTLISSSGQLTLTADTVFFDTKKPVIIPNANITDTLNGKTFHGGDIISNANNTAKYYPMTITPDGAYKSTYFDSAVGLQSSVESGAISYKYRSMIGSGQYLAYDSVINGQGFESQSGYTSAKDTTFSNPETITGYVNVTPASGIYLYGPTQKINFAGNADNIGSNGITMDAYGNIYAQANSSYWRIRDINSNDIADFGIDTAGANNIFLHRELDIGNFQINTGHTFTSADNQAIHFAMGKGGAADIYAGAVHYTSLVKSSLLSVKQDVQKADTAYWAQLVNSIDLATYQYKTDDNTSHLRLSSIVDDVNVTKQWQLPDVFISRDENGKLNGVDDSVLLNATLATVQEQQKQIDQLNGHNMELEARLNKLEAKLNG
ncbi:phage tail protein [Lactiplantibacillus plantarum]|uniref:phage tail protein n=1 Tax=Lactiplantibacillus plantarum TaxID=1590 RepID=UPI000E5A07B2|nr:phage tail protein [Lactiplantibacillus plantarum]MCB7465320.1 phage tail protein [Lactiplantibacillus plantarum]MCB7468563.1 phage tail protein [Lactiplantibacillus plantarum]MCB7472715.1 phage tail protein [Lactiplantibacillus plantarum]MCB7475147.1 phage tail protein [Lactiplantibacillus plantarum]MCB7478748.1 phage tail protein [Lactiplantibacillus plantarum]